VRRTGCAMCGIVLRAREGNDGSVAELVQGPQSCPRWGAPLVARVVVGARVASEMRRARCGYQPTKPWAPSTLLYMVTDKKRNYGPGHAVVQTTLTGCDTFLVGF